MPYADKEKQREYQARWIKNRHDLWFEENGPCKKCGSWKYLELDHIDPKLKISHNVWSWSKERREKELKKCQPLCYDCHKKKTILSLHKPITHGNSGYDRFCRCNICKKSHSIRMEKRNAGMV